jgi:hypothetical protein
MLFQSNTNKVSVTIHVQEGPEPEPRGTIPESVESRQRPAPRNQTRIALIPESVHETLQSLVKLREKVALHSSNLSDLNSRALAPSKSLLEEIETHHIEMETTHALLIALGCRGSSVAQRAKDELKIKLRTYMEHIEHLRDVLTNSSTSGFPVVTPKVINIDKPGEVLDPKDTIHHTDTSGRRALYPLLARFQFVLAAKFVPSACPGLSGPFTPAPE